MKQAKRTRDKGVTRRSIVDCLNKPRTIPELKWHFGSRRLSKDVTIETAIRNMLADGLIEVIDEPRHCYEAARYQFVQICTSCGYRAECRFIYSDAECTKLDYLICDQCYDMINEGWL